jgi:hypothetical protein
VTKLLALIAPSNDSPATGATHPFVDTVMAASRMLAPAAKRRIIADASHGRIAQSVDATVPFARIVRMKTCSLAPWDNASDVLR